VSTTRRVEARLQPAHHAAPRRIGRGRDHEIGLGRPVALDQAHAAAPLERLCRGRRHAGAEAGAHTVRALGRAFGLRQQHRHHRAEQVDHAGAARGDGRPVA
jgi:hypothetical protein